MLSIEGKKTAMEIRPAVAEDRPAIIELLRLSLGESTIPKSEALWSWKHEQNPFGQSYVLLAEENNQLIGVRAFMQWQWEWRGRLYRTIRAVDTATHPEHQGKGIFSRLTRQQLERCRNEGIDFVFNTPNAQSMPGYLKMGWVKLGRMPLKVKLLRPLQLAGASLARRKETAIETDLTPVQKWTHDVFNLVTNYVRHTKNIATSLSPQYISWRYGNNPLYRYYHFTDQQHYLLISRIKDHSIGRELRLVDFVLINDKANSRQVSREMKQAVLRFCREQHVSFISCSGRQYRLHRRWLGWMGSLPIVNRGPMVTLRDLNMEDAFGELRKMRHWGFSLGDMELF